MKNYKPIINPLLNGAMELMKKSDTVEHREMFVEEMLHATFLTPVTIDPMPQPDENGISKVAKDAKVQLPMLKGTDEKNYFMAFTDMEELQKWNKDGGKQVFGFSFADYLEVIRDAKERCGGFVINPYGHNVIVPSALVEEIFAKNPNILKNKKNKPE